MGHPHVPAQADVALSSGPEPKGVYGGHDHSSLDGHLSPHTKFDLSMTILAIPVYQHRQMLHLSVALNPKELVGDMPIAVLMATFPHTPSFSSLGHPHVLAQEDVALASGPEPKGNGGGHVHSSPDSHLSLHTKF